MSLKPRVRAWITTLISALALALAWWASITASSQDTTGGAKTAWMWTGVIATIIGAGLPAFEQFRSIARVENAEVEVLVGLNDTLDAIVAQLGRVATAPSSAEFLTLQRQSIPMVLHSAAQLVDGERVRACWFRYEAGPPERFVPTMAQGRSGTPTTQLVAGNDAGDEALEALRNNRTRFYPDVTEAAPNGWQRQNQIAPKPYKTFIAVPVVAGEVAYGLLTVDALKPNSLGPEDVGFVKLLAGLLAAALAQSY